MMQHRERELLLAVAFFAAYLILRLVVTILQTLMEFFQ
jgi:hypothetical protein